MPAPLAAPQLRLLRLLRARLVALGGVHSQEEVNTLGAQSLPRVLELSLQNRNFTASDHPGSCSARSNGGRQALATSYHIGTCRNQPLGDDALSHAYFHARHSLGSVLFSC